MKKGDVVLIRDSSYQSDWWGRIVSWFVGLFTRSNVVHAALAVDDDKTLVEALCTGVTKRKCQYSNYDVYEAVGATKEQVNGACEWALKQVGKEYDWQAIAGIGLSNITGSKKNIVEDKSKLMCSEEVDAAYAQAGLNITPDVDDSALVTPNDLEESFGLKYLYSVVNGKIRTRG